MKLSITERPSALPAALVSVVAGPVRTVATAHVRVVGRQAVWARTRDGGPQLPILAGVTPSGNVGGFAGKGIDRGDYGMNGASGVPPRGRPV